MSEWVNVPFVDGTAATMLPPVPSDGRPRVFIAVPSYNGWVRMESFDGLMLATQSARSYIRFVKGSLLANTFNRLYATAWNSRKLVPWTHWALHHADIQAPEGWLDMMLAEMDRVGADILSCAVAIKDDRKLSSTGTVEASGNVRRLTLREVHRLPETFSAADLPTLGIHTPLVVNTGLLLVRMDRPWSRKVCFRIGDGMREDASGDIHPVGLPEDWGFSVWANELQLRVFCTRKIVVHHHGEASYSNEEPKEGEGWEKDLGDNPAERDAVQLAEGGQACGL